MLWETFETDFVNKDIGKKIFEGVIRGDCFSRLPIFSIIYTVKASCNLLSSNACLEFQNTNVFILLLDESPLTLPLPLSTLNNAVLLEPKFATSVLINLGKLNSLFNIF